MAAVIEESRDHGLLKELHKIQRAPCHFKPGEHRHEPPSSSFCGQPPQEKPGASMYTPECERRHQQNFNRLDPKTYPLERKSHAERNLAIPINEERVQ